MAYHRIHSGGLTTFGKGVTKNRIHSAGLTLLWKDQPYWGVDFDSSICVAATLTTGDLPYAPWLLDWLVPITERLDWKTEILAGSDRTEQRIAKMEGIAHRSFQATSRIPRADWPEFDAILSKWMRKQWAVPIWPEVIELSTGITADATSITVDTTESSFRAGAYVGIWKSQDENEVVILDSVAAGSLTLGAAVVGTYTAPVWVLPVELGWPQGMVNAGVEHSHTNIEAMYKLSTPSDVTGFTPTQTYDGLTVFTDPTLLVNDTWQQRHSGETVELDYDIGKFSVFSEADNPAQMHPLIVRCETRTQCWWFRQFLYSLDGMQKTFLLPTFDEDITLNQDVGSGEQVLTVLYKRYTENMATAENRLRDYVAFYQDGSLLIRKVTDFTSLGLNTAGEYEEALTLDATVGQAFTAGTKLCWVDKVRLAQDSVDLNWETQNVYETEISVKRVV